MYCCVFDVLCGTNIDLIFRLMSARIRLRNAFYFLIFVYLTSIKYIFLVYYCVFDLLCVLISEDGNEEKNVIMFNLAAYIKPIGAPAGPPGGSQTGISPLFAP